MNIRENDRGAGWKKLPPSSPTTTAQSFRPVAKLGDALARTIPELHDLVRKNEALGFGRELLRGTTYEEDPAAGIRNRSRRKAAEVARAPKPRARHPAVRLLLGVLPSVFWSPLLDDRHETPPRRCARLDRLVSDGTADLHACL